ncbi:hypothetical protein [Luteithermobacter gelatinilyticus]|uniref:hypothetical protein n=1 Tax=Luteithermobacter gelatinilyticus TaxID=2582913 RepID=UPI0011075A25|nr:hypothetical protein [Luteithermobacter gelatinilyticus]|tara:strand:+ start:14889 stop:15119 length:231 start_codon:yes stop_codon:yes gene_type:complete
MMIEKDLSSLSNKKLKKMIADTEEMLAMMKEELKRRKLANQHEEVEHLEDHMNEAEHRMASLKTFLTALFKEMKKS